MWHLQAASSFLILAVVLCPLLRSLYKPEGEVDVVGVPRAQPGQRLTQSPFAACMCLQPDFHAKSPSGRQKAQRWLPLPEALDKARVSVALAVLSLWPSGPQSREEDSRPACPLALTGLCTASRCPSVLQSQTSGRCGLTSQHGLRHEGRQFEVSLTQNVWGEHKGTVACWNIQPQRRQRP